MRALIIFTSTTITFKISVYTIIILLFISIRTIIVGNNNNHFHTTVTTSAQLTHNNFVKGNCITFSLQTIVAVALILERSSTHSLIEVYNKRLKSKPLWSMIIDHHPATLALASIRGLLWSLIKPSPKSSHLPLFQQICSTTLFNFILVSLSCNSFLYCNHFLLYFQLQYFLIFILWFSLIFRVIVLLRLALIQGVKRISLPTHKSKNPEHSKATPVGKENLFWYNYLWWDLKATKVVLLNELRPGLLVVKKPRRNHNQPQNEVQTKFLPLLPYSLHNSWSSSFYPIYKWIRPHFLHQPSSRWPMSPCRGPHLQTMQSFRCK